VSTSCPSNTLTNTYKGDEGKPSCQNCLSRGFECQYAAPLTFLAKNAYTIVGESPKQGGKAKQRYGNLEEVKKKSNIFGSE